VPEWPEAGSVSVRRAFAISSGGKLGRLGWEVRVTGSAAAASPIFKKAGEAQAWASARYAIARWQRRGVCAFAAVPMGEK
jgi:hypothetical protein